MPAEVRDEVELVVVFRRPEEVPELLGECADLGLSKVWLQLGVASPEALEIAEKRNLEIIEEQCLMVVHSLYSSS
jgi:predicted CoA-binding protein